MTIIYNFNWNSSFLGANEIAASVLKFEDTINFPYDIILALKKYEGRKFIVRLNITFQNTNTAFGGITVYSSLKTHSYNLNIVTTQMPYVIPTNYTYHGFAASEASQGNAANCQGHMHISECVPQMMTWGPGLSQIKFIFLTNTINQQFFYDDGAGAPLTCNYFGDFNFELIDE